MTDCMRAGAMRVVKYFSHEESFLKSEQPGDCIQNAYAHWSQGFSICVSTSSRASRRSKSPAQRSKHPTRIRMCACSSLLDSIASAFSVPVLAATLSFVAYTSTSHAFNVATIFSSLALFNLLRQPLMFMPRALSATTDAQNALERLKALFLAELNEGEAFIVDPAQPVGLLVEDATFEWEESPSAREIKEGDGKKGNKKEKAAVKGDVTPVPEQSAPFQVKEVNMSIQRGTLAAVVGSVGSGKVRTQPVSVARIVVGV